MKGVKFMKFRKIIAAVCSAAILCAGTAFAEPEEISGEDDIEVIAAEEFTGEVEPAENYDIELFAASQVFDGGTGTEADPFLISNEDQLMLVGDFPSFAFKLIDNIELTQDWNYIGYNGDDFSGVFDGDGYYISGLTASFVENNRGMIKNTGFKTSEDKLPRQAVVVEYNYGTIEGCYAEGSINSYYDYGGGFAYVNQTGGTIRNCYFKGSVNGNYGNGGFVYYNQGGETENCYCVSTMSHGRGFTYYDYGTIKNCYYDRQVSDCTDADDGYEPKNTLAMKMQATYKDWDFENIWAIDAEINDGYPHFQIDKSAQPAVNSVQLNITEASLVIGETLELTAITDPEDAASSVVWKSSAPSIASVDANGTVTANAMGAAVITASIGSVSAYCAVTVTDNSVKVEKVTLDKSDAGLTIGETLQLAATVTPSDATNKNVRWSSTNTAVATVSASGLVTGISEGTTQIYATSVSNAQCYAICNITVATQKIPVTGIEISGNLFGEFEVNIGKTLTLTPVIKPSNATNKDVRWTSSNSSIATVINGIVTGVSEGSTTITATTVDGGYTTSVIVNVTKPTVYVTGIALNTEQMTVNVRESKKLTAVVTPSDATDKTITFKSNNNAIANVTSDGTVTGVSAGTTLIQAISDTNAGKFIAFCTVTVPKPVVEVTSIKLDKGSLEIVEGKTVPLKAVVKPTNATYQTLAWSTSDESVVTVSQDGYVTARGVGEAVVSATAVNGVYVVCNVTVLSSNTPAQLKVEDATVKAGKQIPIAVSIASNPGISTFTFDLTYDKTKMYPVSYTKGDVLENVTVTTPLGSGVDFRDRTSVRFLCSTTDSKNMDTDGDLITVVFQTLSAADYGDYTIGIVPSAFTNQYYEEINLQSNDCTLSITDYTIGDVNCDDVVDLKDSMILGQYIAGFGNELTPQGKKAAVSIYPDAGDNVETSEPTLNDFQHLFRYLADWQVELGKN